MSQTTPGTLRNLASELRAACGSREKELIQRVARQLILAEDQIEESDARYVDLSEKLLAGFSASSAASAMSTDEITAAVAGHFRAESGEALDLIDAPAVFGKEVSVRAVVKFVVQAMNAPGLAS